MNIWIEFMTGLFLGLPFGVIFNIPKYGKTILLVSIFVIFGCLVFYPNFIAEIQPKPWYMNASNLLGIIIGQFMGKFTLDRAIEELASRR